MWCEMGSCISWHADPAALGEADTRARAIGAGWRIDAFGRLACPAASRPTRASGPPDRSCGGTGTPPSPGPPGPPGAATVRADWASSGDPGRAGGRVPPCRAAGAGMASVSASVPAAAVLQAVRGWRLFPCRTEIDPAVMAAHRSQPTGSTGCRWLMPAAEMARPGRAAAGGHRRIPPGQTGPARRGSPRARSAHRPGRSVLRGTSPSPPCAGGARHTAARTSRSWCLRW